ncbi:type IX secretion system outer membrane channel protein PorV [Longimonas sp.]|uniref:type IX secretion system outer membrane channel protein PorV n=1 Tax=Longimonas sp. TaxID=2039626 RepID=UPI0039764842
MTLTSSHRSLRQWIGVVGTTLLLLTLTTAAHAQLGQSSALFLRIEPDSRGAGMGNTGVALADNANAMFWNPAGLGFQETSEVGITHANWLPEFDAGLFYEYLVGTYHLDGVGTFGGNIIFLNLGELEVIDGDGNEVRVDNTFEMATGLSYGRKLSETFSIGAGARFIYSKLSESEGDVDSGTATTGTFDLSALYRSQPFDLLGVPTTFSGGANLANMGTHIRYSEEKQAVPTNLRLGYALTFDFDEYNSLTLANDFNKEMISVDSTGANPDPFYQSIFTSWESRPGELRPGDEDPTELGVIDQFTVGSGLEYWYADLFSLRTGYFYEHPDNGNRQFLTFGAGVRWNIVGIDFSYLYTLEEDNPLSDTLRFSLLLSFQ